MIWPLGKKFDLWVDADRSDVLELLTNPESFDSQHPIAFFESATVTGNLVVVPARIHMVIAREIWAVLSESHGGVRVRGRYGFWLSMQNFVWVTIAPIGIALAIVGDPGWTNGVIGASVIVLFDRVTRPFARRRYDDFVLFLKHVSRDAVVHNAQ